MDTDSKETQYTCDSFAGFYEFGCTLTGVGHWCMGLVSRFTHGLQRGLCEM